MSEDLHEHEIDGLFRRGLESAEDSPSPGLWSAIEKGLDTAMPPQPPPSAPTAGGSWMHPLLLKGLAGIAILATVGTASYFLGRDSQRREAQRQAETTETTIPPYTPVQPSIPKEDSDTDPSKISQTPVIHADGTASEERVDDRNIPVQKAMDAVVLHPNSSRLPSKVASTSAAEMRNPAADVPKPETQAGSKAATSPAEKTAKSPSNRAESKPGRLSELSRPTTTDLATSDAAKGRDEKSVPPPDPSTMERREYASPVVEATTPGSRRLTLTAPLPGTRSIPERVSPVLTKPTEGNRTRPGIDRQLMSRISVMPMLSANTTSKRIEENKEFGPRNGREHREMAETETYGTTVSPGLYAAFEITPRLSVQSGFSELRNEISISPKEIKAVRDQDNNVRYRLDCSAGTFFIDPKTGTPPIVGDSIRLKGSNVQTRYASIPLHLMYHLGNGRLKVYGLVGAEMNLLVGRNATTTFQNAASQQLGMVRAEGLRPTMVNAVMGAGLELGIGKRLSLNVIPQYRTALRNANEEGPVKSYPKTLSVAAGLRVGF